MNYFNKKQLGGILSVIQDLSGGSRQEIIDECMRREVISASSFVEYILDVHLIPMGYVKSFHLEQARYNISQVGEVHLISLC